MDEARSVGISARRSSRSVRCGREGADLFVVLLVFCRLASGGGESSCTRSRAARVDSLRRAILRSDGGGGRLTGTSSGGVSDELRIGTGWGLKAAVDSSTGSDTHSEDFSAHAVF